MGVRPLADGDETALFAGFAEAGWPGKTPQLFAGLRREHAAGERVVLVAEAAGALAGYVTVVWGSGYPPFREAGIPEIVDFNVLPRHRRRGLGGALLDAAEAAVAERSEVAGIGCGLYADYAAAMRLYLRRGYLPDGRGVVYAGAPVAAGGTVRLDDDAVLMFTRRL